jgi:hypothetical protein
MSVQILSTGWYCNKTPRDYKTHGDDFIRGIDFRPLWWRSINKFVRPERVFVVDSASPVVPDDQQFTDSNIEWLRLPVNPGHAQTTRHHYCGWMASILHGLEYTLSSGADYFLYVEQDALIHGESFVKTIEDKLSRSKYVFGNGNGTPWLLQQSVFAIRKEGIRPFLAGLHRVVHSDRLISPELKFALAIDHPCWVIWIADLFLNPIINDRLRYRLGNCLLSIMGGFSTLPFGYGRSRPINFNDDTFYFQHASKDELSVYLTK